jgi:TrpR-related protein YerC/YecD
MKTSHRRLSPQQEARCERSLITAMLTLRTLEEYRSFLRDLCTPAELQAMADRWAVVECLRRGLPYREVHRQTAVSMTTIGRVARYLAQGHGGYALAAQRLDGHAAAPVADGSAPAAGRAGGARSGARRSAHGGPAQG